MLDLPPQIVIQPSSQLVTPGVNVTFSVSAIGTPSLHYQWQLNNTNLIGATNTTLALNNVQPTNTGNYLVVVTNAFGTATSTTARLLVAAPGTNCTSAPADLIAWWPGEGNANDVVGGHNGVLTNGAAFAAGIVGQAFSFSGSSEGVLIPYSTFTDFSTMSGWTIEAWINPTSFNNQNYPTIYSKGYWAVSLGLNSGSGALESWINNANQLVGTISVPLGQWSHVALVYDGTNRTFYVNGRLAGSGSAPSITSDTSNSAIGSVATLDGRSSFNGLIDEVSIYNRALSFDEIAATYLAGSYGKCEEVPPTLLTQPQSQSIPAGSNVVFSVSAVGEQPLYYQWQRNGVNLGDAGNITGSTNASLIISNISSSDAGTYFVIVSNAFGFVTSTGAVLSVNVLQNGGFESGSLDGWAQSGNTGGTYLSGSSAYDHSGSYGLQAGPGGSLGYLSQTIPTQPGAAYLLSFWFDSQGGTPNEFLVVWNDNTLFDQTNIPAIGWTNMQFIVAAIGTNTVLKFGFRNDPIYFGLDDISVSAISAPPLLLSSAGFSTNGGFQLYVYGQIGQAYTLQASTNLVNWVLFIELHLHEFACVCRRSGGEKLQPTILSRCSRSPTHRSIADCAWVWIAATVDNEWFVSDVAGADWIQLHDSSFDRPCQLADDYEFCEHDFACLFQRPGSDKFQSTLLPGGDAVVRVVVSEFLQSRIAHLSW